jgi:ribosomal protein S3
MVGRVIGKGGETIKNLQRKYHTSIQVGSQVRITTLDPGYREGVVCADSCRLAQADVLGVACRQGGQGSSLCAALLSAR